MLDNLAPLLPGEENPWPYETNPHWRHDACYDINVHSRTNPNISITAAHLARECPEDLGAGRSIPWCPTFDSKYTAERVDCIWSKYCFSLIMPPKALRHLQVMVVPGPTRIESIRTKGTRDSFIQLVCHSDFLASATRFFVYTERDQIVVFEQKNYTDTTHMLHNTTLRYIRLIPLTWVGKIRLQIELHKCWYCGDGFWDQMDEGRRWESLGP